MTTIRASEIRRNKAIDLQEIAKGLPMAFLRKTPEKAPRDDKINILMNFATKMFLNINNKKPSSSTNAATKSGETIKICNKIGTEREILSDRNKRNMIIKLAITIIDHRKAINKIAITLPRHTIVMLRGVHSKGSSVFSSRSL